MTLAPVESYLLARGKLISGGHSFTMDWECQRPSDEVI